MKLLSFGGDEDAEEEQVVFKKKPIVRPDRELCYVNFVGARAEVERHATVIDNPELPASLSGAIPEPPAPKAKPPKRDRTEDPESRPVRPRMCQV